MELLLYFNFDIRNYKKITAHYQYKKIKERPWEEQGS